MNRSFSKRKPRAGTIRLCTIFLLVVIFTATMAFAGGPGRGTNAPTAGRIISDISSRLDLTDEQVDLVRPVIENRVRKRDEIFRNYRSQGRSGRGAQKTEIAELNFDTEMRLAKVLTTGQMEQYRKMKEEQRAGMRKGGSGRRRGRF